MSEEIRYDSPGFSPPRSSIRHFSLMNALLNVINNTDADDSDSVLARYFLEHFDHLHELNVYDVAEACFTSRSGIRRFCQSIGCDHFSDLKSYSWEWSRHRALFAEFAEHEDFSRYLASQIAEMVVDVSALADEGELDRLAGTIRDAREVVLITSDFSSMAVREFQQSMLYSHKIVRLITDSFGDIDCLKALDADDLVVVVSSGGNYARAVLEQIEGSSAGKILVTMSRDAALASAFDRVLYLAPVEHSGQRTVYAQYGISYFFDLLYNRYHCLFG